MLEHIPPSMPLRIENLEGTDFLGTCIAKALSPGLVIAMDGNLGAGKTRLTQAIVTSLGVPESAVNSPTFVLIQEYDARLPIYHFDAYRLNDTDEFLQLGADELMFGEGVCLIEWASRVEDVLPQDRLSIDIKPVSTTQREVTLQAGGTISQTALTAILSQWQSTSS